MAHLLEPQHPSPPPSGTLTSLSENLCLWALDLQAKVETGSAVGRQNECGHNLQGRRVIVPKRPSKEQRFWFSGSPRVKCTPGFQDLLLPAFKQVLFFSLCYYPAMQKGSLTQQADRSPWEGLLAGRPWLSGSLDFRGAQPSLTNHSRSLCCGCRAEHLLSCWESGVWVGVRQKVPM